MSALTPDQIARLRLQSLGLTGAGVLGAAATPRDVVAHHLALQAQDWTASRWVIGSRLAATGAPADEATVTAAYNAGEIVRAWPMRGTVHATAAEDLRWLNEIAGKRMLRGLERRWENLGIDEAFLERARQAIHELLDDEVPRTREQIAAALAEHGIDLNGGVRYHVIWYLTQTESIVLGPVDEASGDHAAVLQERHLPPPSVIPEAERESELARRYLHSHGPAELEDLVWWTGMTKTAIRRAVAALGDEAMELDCDGRTLLMLTGRHEQLDPDCEHSASATLALAAFDEHLLAYKNRSDVLDDKHATLVDPARNGVFRATIVQDGRVIATWKRKPMTNHVRVIVTPFARTNAAKRKRIVAALQPWGAFIGRELEVVFDD